MYRLTDVDIEEYYPELADNDLTEKQLKNFFFHTNGIWNEDYDKTKEEFESWLADCIKCGFFEKLA